MHREDEDLGNIVLLEHYNCTVTDQRLATLFYVVGLGGTRDPFLMVGLDNMWVNFGRTQVHLPSRGAAPGAQRLRGVAGFVVPSLDAVADRLAFAAREIDRVMPGAEHRMAYSRAEHCIEATCPWGNRIRCHGPSPAWPRAELGLVYVDFDVPAGAAEGIARFYAQVMKAAVRTEPGRATVRVGTFQMLRFTETSAEQPPYDGHHIAIYIADFWSPHRWLADRALLTQDAAAHEWRFEWICDPDDGRRLFQLEHEVRGLEHPLRDRLLVNRNQALTTANFERGREAFPGAY